MRNNCLISLPALGHSCCKLVRPSTLRKTFSDSPQPTFQFVGQLPFGLKPTGNFVCGRPSSSGVVTRLCELQQDDNQINLPSYITEVGPHQFLPNGQAEAIFLDRLREEV